MTHDLKQEDVLYRIIRRKFNFIQVFSDLRNNSVSPLYSVSVSLSVSPQ